MMTERGCPVARKRIFLAHQFLLLAVAVSPGACAHGAAHATAMDECEDVRLYGRIFIQKPEVVSEEDPEEVAERNAHAAAYLEGALAKAIRTQIPDPLTGRPRFELTPAAGARALTLRSKLKIAYGSRTLRYLFSFGAGAGQFDLSLRLIDEATMEEKLDLHGSTELEVGLLGGSMDAALEGTIDKAVDQFVKVMNRAVSAPAGAPGP
jgi:hypothetical protein